MNGVTGWDTHMSWKLCSIGIEPSGMPNQEKNACDTSKMLGANTRKPEIIQELKNNSALLTNEFASWKLPGRLEIYGFTELCINAGFLSSDVPGKYPK